MNVDSVIRSISPRFVLFFAVAMLTLTGCGDIYRYVSSGELGWAIKKEIRDRSRTEITLSKLTLFPWDDLVIFSAYTPRMEICKRLALDEIGCNSADLSEPMNDGLNLLVFRLNGKIVHREIHLGEHGEFRVEEQSFTPQDAVFVVEPHATLGNGKRQLILRWKPPSSANPSTIRRSP